MKKTLTLLALAIGISITPLVDAEDRLSAENELSVDKANADSPAVVDRTNKFKPIILPFYDPSIEAGISAVPLFAFYPDDNDLVSDASTIAVPLIYTTNGSYIAKLAGDIILLEDNFRISFETGFTSTNNTLAGIDSNKETIDFDADVMLKVMDNVFVGIGGVYVSSRYTADDSFEQAALEQMGFTGDYQNDIGYRISMQWDTREHFYYPHNGFVWDVQYENHAEWLGNDKDNTYSSFFSDYRHFYSLDNNPNHIFATKLVARYLLDAESAPSSAYTTYGRQGKEVQRGFAVGDYIASNMVNLETEYRHKFQDTGSDFWDRSAVVGIFGAGKSFGEQLDGVNRSFSDNDWLGVVGIGYRYNILPYERLNIKVDLTYNSDGETIAYFGFGESI